MGQGPRALAASVSLAWAPSPSMWAEPGVALQSKAQHTCAQCKQGMGKGRPPPKLLPRNHPVKRPLGHTPGVRQGPGVPAPGVGGWDTPHSPSGLWGVFVCPHSFP